MASPEGEEEDDDRKWMNINAGDMDVADELIAQNVPLKQASWKLVFSEPYYFLTCQDKEHERRKLFYNIKK